jgi:diguanylate cyclase (GGDEF)-like protein/PAS domain S-box-containing protein
MQMKPMRMALHTSVAYALFAALWILLSDRALVALVSDPHAIGRLSIYKGWAFVAVTGFLLYGTLRNQFQRWQREVSERKQAEESLRTSQLRLSEAMDMARLAYWEADGTTGVFMFNDALYDLIGTSAVREGGYTMPIEQYFRKFVHPDDLSMVHRFVEGIRSSDSDRPDDFDARLVRVDGEVRHILTRLRVLRGPAGQNTKIFGINQDITERKKTEESLRESESRFRGAFEASGIGMVLVALDGRWLKVNQSFCDMVGYSEQELLAKTFQDLTHPDDLKNDLEYVQRLIDDQIPYYRLEKRYYHRDGYIVWGALSVSLVRDARGYPLYFVGQIEDITEKKLFEEKLQTMLVTDELTGLYNRKGFFELASEKLMLASERHVLFFADLDCMKWINDRLGHREGDAALATVARLLKDTFRESDIIGRIGGDEFSILVTGATEDEEEVLLARLHHNIERFNADRKPSIPVSLSIGFSHREPEDSRPLEALLAEADESMYEKKRCRRRIESEVFASPTGALAEYAGF